MRSRPRTHSQGAGCGATRQRDAQARRLQVRGSSCLIAPVRVSSPPLQVRDTNSGAKIVQRFATLVGLILAAVLPVNAVQSQSQSKEVMTLLRYEKLLDGICRSHIPILLTRTTDGLPHAAAGR